MPRVRAIKSFIWKLRDIDIGEVFEVSEREAFLLIHGYKDAVAVDGDAPPVPGAMVVDGDPVVEHRDPARRRKAR